MTRLRYLADRPRGPKGGHNDVRHVYSDREGAKRAAMPRSEFRSRGRIVRAAIGAGRVYVVDLDCLLPIDATPDELFQWHEAQMQFHLAEVMRLRGDQHANAPPPSVMTTEDIARLREVAEQFVSSFPRMKRTRAIERVDYAVLYVLKYLLEQGKLGPRRNGVVDAR